MKRVGLFFILFVLSSCSAPDATEVKTKQKLQELKEKYRLKKMEECETQFEHDLNALADSILIVLSKKNKYDSLSIPYDSVRPEKPEITFPEFKKPEKPE